MSEIQFIANDPEAILSETIATYQQAAGETLHPADPERILIDVMAYRENVLRARMEFLMRQNFVQYATAPALDNWGALFGVSRLSDEADDECRLRILNNTHQAIGTEEAYRQRILSLPEVSDLMITRKSDEPTLPPGTIRLTPLMRAVSQDGVESGAVHTAELEQTILNTIQAADFGVIGPKFIFSEAHPVPLSGRVSVRAVLGADRETLERNVNRKIAAYFGTLSLHYAGDFGAYDLERAVLAADGVLSVAAVDFSNIPVKRPADFYVQGAVTVDYL
ncbi:baseplate J/gp47 family protein [uncultured Rikenella sp.]|uniref:baseplate J/gp47 family protein n=1 Tax=uncultured Rikenella sp. TaxID=368003 RepID=UPI0026028084|nr:baseplate J/gp47 family protein [uncultured Rikenella sp.]